MSVQHLASDLLDARMRGDLNRAEASLEALAEPVREVLERAGIPRWSLEPILIDVLRTARLEPPPPWIRLAGHARAAARRRIERSISAHLLVPDALVMLYQPAMQFFQAHADGEEARARNLLGELEPFLRSDLSQWWHGAQRRELLQGKGLIADDVVSSAIDRLALRGADWPERSHHPYRVLLKWLKTTSYRQALDARDADPSGEIDELRGGRQTSPESLLLAADELREQQDRIRFLREELRERVRGDKQRKILDETLLNPDISSLELAVQLGDLDPALVDRSDPEAIATRKRACNAVDKQRQRLRELAMTLWLDWGAEPQRGSR